MTVRRGLLAILDQGPCYGYQLRSEFERRTGSTWPLNAGQVYSTLERHERDGLVTKKNSDGQGHVYFEITEAGRAEARSWLASPVQRSAESRDELAIKLAVAATLSGVDVSAMIDTQRETTLAYLETLRAATFDGEPKQGPAQLAWSLIQDRMIMSVEAEIRWLDQSAKRLAQHPHAMELEIDTELPKRGRPPIAPR